MTAKNSWYIKIGSHVRGPFTAKLVAKRILLGRLSMHDEASQDNINWKPIYEIAELIPDLLKQDQSDPFVKERIAAARRWADERLGRDRRARLSAQANAQFSNQRTGQDRRSVEDQQEMSYRVARQDRIEDEEQDYEITLKYEQRRYWFPYLIILAIVIGTTYSVYRYFPFVEEGPVTSCESPAAPKVDWSNCSMQGMDGNKADLRQSILRNANFTAALLREAKLTQSEMSYVIMALSDLQGADLSMSNLLGANFKNANLTESNLSSSNLSYADLSGANITGANLQGATLDKAIWVDGRVCALGSIGECK